MDLVFGITIKYEAVETVSYLHLHVKLMSCIIISTLQFICNFVQCETADRSTVTSCIVHVVLNYVHEYADLF